MYYICLKLWFPYRKVVGEVMDTHENAKEAKRKLQAYKAKIGKILYPSQHLVLNVESIKR